MERNRKRRYECPMDQEDFQRNDRRGIPGSYRGVPGGANKGDQRGYHRNDRGDRQGANMGGQRDSHRNERGDPLRGGEFHSNARYRGDSGGPRRGHEEDPHGGDLGRLSPQVTDDTELSEFSSPQEQIRYMRKKQRMLLLKIEQEERLIRTINTGFQPGLEFGDFRRAVDVRDQVPMDMVDNYRNPLDYESRWREHGSDVQRDLYDVFGDYQGGYYEADDRYGLGEWDGRHGFIEGDDQEFGRRGDFHQTSDSFGGRDYNQSFGGRDYNQSFAGSDYNNSFAGRDNCGRFGSGREHGVRTDYSDMSGSGRLGKQEFQSFRGWDNQTKFSTRNDHHGNLNQGVLSRSGSLVNPLLDLPLVGSDPGAHTSTASAYFLSETNLKRTKPKLQPHVAIGGVTADYTGRLAKSGGDFDEKMDRLKVTIPLQSLVSEVKMAQQKLVTIEDFRTLVGNHKKVKAICFFLRHTDPTDTSVRNIECQLYINNIYISSAKTRIARCSMEDLNEPIWTRCEERKDVLNDSYLTAWRTLTTTPVHDICNNHRMLKAGEVPEGTFSHICHGSGKYNTTNISGLVRMKHPYKPWFKDRLEDLVLINCEEETENSSFRILTRSCNHSGLLMEVENELKQFLQMNELICKLYIAKVLIASCSAGKKETARQQTADAAYEKLKKTQSYIQILPEKNKYKEKDWETFVAEAETWYKTHVIATAAGKGMNNAGTSAEKEFPASSGQADKQGSSSSTGKTSETAISGQQPPDKDGRDMFRSQMISDGQRVKSAAGAQKGPVTAANKAINRAENSTTATVQAKSKTSFANTWSYPQASTGVQRSFQIQGSQTSTTGTGGSLTGQISATVQTASSVANPNVNAQGGLGNNYMGYADMGWFGHCFMYDQYGYCYMLDSNGQYVPYNHAQAMLLNAEYSQRAGQFTGQGMAQAGGMQKYNTKRGLFGTGGQTTCGSQLSGNQSLSGSQIQNKGRWDQPIRKRPGSGKTLPQLQQLRSFQNLEQSLGENSKQILSGVYANMQQQLPGSYQVLTKTASVGSSGDDAKRKKHKPIRGVMKSNRLLSSSLICSTEGKFIHWREPLLPANQRVVEYMEHIIAERSQNEDDLSEIYFCNEMPLAERQALEVIGLKYDFKLVVCAKRLKVTLVRWTTTQEMLACLKRNNNRSKRIVLLREDGVPTGVNIDD